MTHAAWSVAPAGTEPRFDTARIVAAGAALVILLVYSQGWVFPLFGETIEADAGGLLRTLFFPAYAAGFVLAALAPRAALLVLVRQPFLILLMIVAAVSVTWSIAPDITLRRVIAVYLTTFGAVALAARFRWAELAELIAAAFAFLAVAAALTALLVPSVGIMSEIFPGAWRGLWAEKNGLGGNMAIAFAVLTAAAALNPERAKLWLPFAGLALGLVLMSTSKTSLVALVMGAGAMGLVALARRGPAAGVATVWMGVAGLGALAAVLLFASDQVFDILGKDATLTGRTKIWAAIMRQVAERPWTGFGYDTVWSDKSPWGPFAWIVKQAGFAPQHAHNAWLEQWLGMGLIGLSAFALFYLQAVTLALVAMFRHRGAYLAVPFLTIYSLMTLTESVAVTYNDLRWVLFAAIAAKLAWPERPPA